MIEFDEVIDRKRLEQFASQIKHLAPTLIDDFDRCFKKNQNPDFYRGLLSAYVTSFSIVHQYNPGSKEDQILGALVSYLSDLILRNDWYY